MYRIDCNSVDELLEKISLRDYALIDHYIHYDECYKDDSWIKYSIFYEDGIDDPICVIAKRLPDEEIGHILILEVKNSIKHMGYGKKALNMYMQDKPYWELFSVETAEGFYKKLGFKKYFDTFYYGVDFRGSSKNSL